VSGFVSLIWNNLTEDQCPSIYSFWLHPFGILWPLYCLSFLDLRFLFTPLVSCGHCIFCPSSIIQRPHDIKGVIRSRKSRKDRQYNGHRIPKG
jgi:hypothetical protein